MEANVCTQTHVTAVYIKPLVPDVKQVRQLVLTLGKVCVRVRVCVWHVRVYVCVWRVRVRACVRVCVCMRMCVCVHAFLC